MRADGAGWLYGGEKRWPYALWLVLAVALLLRLGWALSVESGARTTFLFDASFYQQAARHLSMGRGYLNGSLRPTAFFPPGYPMLLAGLYFLFGKKIIIASLFNAFAGTLTCLLTYAIGARAYGARVGLGAAAILAIWPGAIYGTSATLSDTVFTCLLTSAVLCFQILAAQGPRGRSAAWLGVGVLLGITTLVRGAGLPFVGVLVLLLLVEQGMRREAVLRAALMTLGVVLVLAPWSVRNLRVMGAPVLLATEGAWSLFNAHNPLANGTQTFEMNAERVRLFGSDVDMESPEAEIRLEQAQMAYSIRYALTHPMHELSLVPRRIYYLHANDSWAMPWIGRWSRPFDGEPELMYVLDRRVDAALPPIANLYYWTVLVFSLAGFVLALSPSRKSAWIVPATVIYFHALHGLLFFGIPRYHLPFSPELAILAALALARLPWPGRRSGDEPEAEQESIAATPAGGRVAYRRLRAPFVLGSLSLAIGCGAEGPQQATPTRPNLLLITIDTLRADHLGAWGYDRPTSPRVDGLAEQSVVFEQAMAHSSWTLPSLASAMTSLYTATHRCWGFSAALHESHLTLAEVLAGEGYATAGVASHIFLGSNHGLHQGFEHYDETLVKKVLGESHEAITSPDVTERGLSWLKARDDRERPFFLWLHYFDPHESYLEHPGLSQQFGVSEELSLYDGEIAFTDRAIGDLLDGLDRLGLADETLVVLFADHGEEFGEHGGTRHGHTVHRELVHVPLLIRAPGFAPRRVGQTVRLVDLMPTLLGLIGVDPPPDIEGESLVPAMRGEEVPELGVFAQVKPNMIHSLSSLQRGRWKLIIDSGTKEVTLFDIESDPAELRNVAEREPAVVERMREELTHTIALARAKAKRYKRGRVQTVSEEERESLRKLGYIE